jgi:hypothetical protein
LHFFVARTKNIRIAVHIFLMQKSRKPALMNVLIGLSPSEVADVISYAAKLRASHKD